MDDINKNAGITDYIWDPKKGPLENALRLIGIGGLLGIGGKAAILLGVSNFLGLDLGSYLDKKFNLNNVNDLKNLNPEEASKIASDELWDMTESSIKTSGLHAFASDGLEELEKLEKEIEEQQKPVAKPAVKRPAVPKPSTKLEERIKSKHQNKVKELEVANEKRKEFEEFKTQEMAKRREIREQERASRQKQLSERRKERAEYDALKAQQRKEELMIKHQPKGPVEEKPKTDPLTSKDDPEDIKLKKKMQEIRYKNALQLYKTRSRPSLSILYKLGGKVALYGAIAALITYVVNNVINKPIEHIPNRTKVENTTNVQPANNTPKSKLEAIVNQILTQ